MVLLVIFIHKSHPTYAKNVYFHKYIDHNDKFEKKLKSPADRHRLEISCKLWLLFIFKIVNVYTFYIFFQQYF